MLAWHNIKRTRYVGESNGYTSKAHAVGTTNGAGPRNVQLLVLAPDSTVLHALPGFWHAEDLARELRFAEQVHRLHQDQDRTEEQKLSMFARLHRSEVARQPADAFARSGWQGFDARTEQARLMIQPDRDTFQRHPSGNIVMSEKGQPQLKRLNVVAHERMMQQPFKKLNEFDFEAFVDYGVPYYDNNRGKDKGRKL